MGVAVSLEGERLGKAWSTTWRTSCSPAHDALGYDGSHVSCRQHRLMSCQRPRLDAPQVFDASPYAIPICGAQAPAPRAAPHPDRGPTTSATRHVVRPVLVPACTVTGRVAVSISPCAPRMVAWST